MSTREATPARDAVNDLYDHGCDLVDAAVELHAGADAPGAARAVPAVTGCLESALRELAVAAAGLERAAMADDASSSPGRRARRRQGFANLEVALQDAADAAAAARALAARAQRDPR